MGSKLFLAFALICSGQACFALEGADSVLMHLKTGAVMQLGGGEFAPYFIGSNTGGRYVDSDQVTASLGLERPLTAEKRFDYGFGGDVQAGYFSSANYEKYNPSDGEWWEKNLRPKTLWVRELWGGLKYRSLFIWAGMKPQDNPSFHNDLGVGDMVLSNNAMPVPQVRAGFIDFQNIPFTNGRVQTQGELGYGKLMDSNWLEQHYNYYNSFITTGVYMHYSRLYLRTDPRQPLVLTIGMQQAAQFGGTWRTYQDGVEKSSHKLPVKFRDFTNALLPWTGGSSDTDGDIAYYSGNHLGSWDVKLAYRFSGGAGLTLSLQSPWEDGSGIGKRNGWDGIWSLRYDAADKNSWLTSVSVEYVDFTNQSGAIAWAPEDYPGTQVAGRGVGADDYYNNYMYNGWTNYGMTMGTPFITGTVYNTDGYMRIQENRVRGVQAGACGVLNGRVQWRALVNYRTGWGTPFLPRLHKSHTASGMLECRVPIAGAPGLVAGGAIAFDAGANTHHRWAAQASISYNLPILK